jgi:hypothetical protein
MAQKGTMVNNPTGLTVFVHPTKRNDLVCKHPMMQLSMVVAEAANFQKTHKCTTIKGRGYTQEKLFALNLLWQMHLPPEVLPCSSNFGGQYIAMLTKLYCTLSPPRYQPLSCMDQTAYIERATEAGNATVLRRRLKGPSCSPNWA